jgi:hypothetical protein
MNKDITFNLPIGLRIDEDIDYWPKDHPMNKNRIVFTITQMDKKETEEFIERMKRKLKETPL